MFEKPGFTPMVFDDTFDELAKGKDHPLERVGVLYLVPDEIAATFIAQLTGEDAAAPPETFPEPPVPSWEAPEAPFAPYPLP